MTSTDTQVQEQAPEPEHPGWNWFIRWAEKQGKTKDDLVWFWAWSGATCYLDCTTAEMAANLLNGIDRLEESHVREGFDSIYEDALSEKDLECTIRDIQNTWADPSWPQFRNKMAGRTK